MRKEGNVLFNDALNTLFTVMVNDHSDSEKGNPLLPHELLFLINSKGSFICISLYAHTHTHTDQQLWLTYVGSNMGPIFCRDFATLKRTLATESVAMAVMVGSINLTV